MDLEKTWNKKYHVKLFDGFLRRVGVVVNMIMPICWYFLFIVYCWATALQRKGEESKEFYRKMRVH